MELIPILIPYGGLNGEINECLLSVANQVDCPGKQFHIHVLRDSRLNDTQVKNYVVQILRKKGVGLTVHYDTNTTSILDMRIKLVTIASQLGAKRAVFFDSDALMDVDALRNMILTWDAFTFDVAGKSEPEPPAFIEGLRIEVGGRENEKEFSTLELKQVKEGTGDKPFEIFCGDTCFLMFDVRLFMKCDVEYFREYLDEISLTGEDFAWSVDALMKSDRKAWSAPSAIVWHTASQNAGYWKNFAGSDKLLKSVIFARYKDRDKINNILTRVFGG